MQFFIKQKCSLGFVQICKKSSPTMKIQYIASYGINGETIFIQHQNNLIYECSSLTKNSSQAFIKLKTVLLLAFASENSINMFLIKNPHPRSPSPYEMELAT